MDQAICQLLKAVTHNQAKAVATHHHILHAYREKKGKQEEAGPKTMVDHF